MAATSSRDVHAVLAGDRSYDDLSSPEQAFVRAAWSTRMDELRGALDLAREFAAAGRSWVEVDDEGDVRSCDA